MTDPTTTTAAPTIKYLEKKIVEAYQASPNPRTGMCVGGYTKRSGAPTSYMVRLEGETRFRRLMTWCFSNSGVLFLKVKGEDLIVREEQVPVPTTKPIRAPKPVRRYASPPRGFI